MTSDRLYSNGRIAEDFTFNDSVAEVFDDMLDRSIPFYQTVIELTAALIRQLAAPGSRVYDLGCSTGTTLLVLSRLLADMDLHFTGIDNAPAMIAKARRKVEMYGKSAVIEFRTADITQVELPGADIIVCNYTMQFIRPLKREEFVRRIYSNLRPGGVLLLSEKVISHDHRINREYIDIYHDIVSYFVMHASVCTIT
ncbi:MAG: tRNA (cmo5U34)-methyltransferase [Desulfobulbus sp.]|nr:MAG: tRNA (cmo5U34)-methyltransferase [Desulfobulbus sp.]